MDLLRALTLFCKVVDAGGMTEAARALGLSKAMTSKSVASLERELGVQLLHRTTRSVQPTTTGRAVYKQGRALLEQASELEATARAETAEPTGTLRITAPVTAQELGLGDVLAAFVLAHPALRLEVSLTDRFVRLTDEGFDVAIRIARRLEDEDVVSVRLGETRMITCASPAYLATRGRPRTPADLRAHACIAYAPAGSAGRVSWQLGDEGATWLEPTTRVDSALLQRDLARAGVGVARLLSFVADRDLRAKTLVALFDRGDPEADEVYGIHALYPTPRHASAKVRLLVGALRAAFARAPWSRRAR